jgi:flagellar motor switch protein FliN/FliY
MTDEKDLDLSADAENPEEQAETPEVAEGDAEVASEAGMDEAAADGGDVAVSEADAAPDAEAGEGADEAAEDFKVVNDSDASEDDAEAAMLEMLEGLPQDNGKSDIDDINFGSAAVSKAEFQQLQEPVSGPESRNIDLLMDVDLPISIELGRTKMSISDILALGPGSVVELNKLAGEPVDLLVNYKVVAKGEVVVVDENFGLRITQLMTPEERLKALAEE